ncbi:aldo/keto reductase [Deinococcus sp.]|uniref:aldo/keto reductase n=1 Tax=Deinococcus sp. TaxID=47478 RepID=UPI0025E57DA8|nr:aldo/keto reductase [Deinococcus sp.]
MEQRVLGSSGLRVSVVGLGGNNFGGRLDQALTDAVVTAALDQGVTFFDTADVYGNNYGNRGGSEVMLGRALGAERGRVVLASKFGHDMGEAGKGAAPAYIRAALEASLRRLGTDYLDVYQLHLPDPATPIAETLGTLHELVGEGLVRAVGCSNLGAAGVRQAADIAQAQGWSGFVSAQDEYSLLCREAEAQLLPTLEDLEMGLLPYFPLASGLLSGKYQPGRIPPGTRFAASPGIQRRYMTPENWRKVRLLQDFAARQGRSLLELAFSWLAAQPSVSSIIAGATTPEQVAQNIGAVGWQLGAAELTEVDQITQDQAALSR